MYTYDSFVTEGSFTLLRPVYITLAVFSLCLFFLIIFPKLKHRLLNGIAVAGLSLVFAVITVQVIYYDAIIVDELGLGGSTVNTTLSVAVIGLSILNPFLYFGTHRKEED
ncbi:hypothetical protein JSY36_05835 [Bacillus sp. H-16]|uniref:hypothetical protein n=1 Tax=Alteribacter salitolerans TaxID=2912333 RepID=UPI001964907D|nr:hypothetical protein [Alteribacter salitolerans]MBM7095270.1 hypothetical protein [Alteribacter salitolerans]